MSSRIRNISIASTQLMEPLNPGTYKSRGELDSFNATVAIVLEAHIKTAVFDTMRIVQESLNAATSNGRPVAFEVLSSAVYSSFGLTDEDIGIYIRGCELAKEATAAAVVNPQEDKK